MITPSHLIYSWAVAKATAQPEANPARTRTFIFAALLPDLPIYLFFFYHVLFTSVSQRELWDVMYFASAWTPFFQASHSFLLWGAVLTVGYLFARPFLVWVGSATLLHAAMDFLVHHDDAYPHFWPLSDWKFMSPVSYWDPTYYGQYIGALDTLIVVVLLLWLYQRYESKHIRRTIIGLVSLYVILSFTPVIGWIFM